MLKFIVFLNVFRTFALVGSELAYSNDIPSVTMLITEHGYPAETHKVTTEDDYILTIHRIPHGANNTQFCKGVVVLLHGLFLSAADWLFIGPNDALPFLLADAGYDVWLCNSRGNDQSQEHLYLNPNISPSPYWDFSWHEMGIYDLPAVINYALSVTGQQNVTLVCHSQGCTETFVACTFRPCLLSKINALFALGPAAYVGNTENLFLRLIAETEQILAAEAEAGGYYKFSPTEGLLREVLGLSCSDITPITPELCNLLLVLTVDTSLRGTNKTILETMLHYTPSSVSMKQNLHYGQCINCFCFRQFNEPLYYNLSQVLFPVFVFYAINDKVTVFTDVRRTISELGNCEGEYFIQDLDFGHMDFNYGINAKTFVYDPIMEQLKKMHQQKCNQSI